MCFLILLLNILDCDYSHLLYYLQFSWLCCSLVLEGEMFQLNNILTEQKELMETMTTIFATKTKGT